MHENPGASTPRAPKDTLGKNILARADSFPNSTEKESATVPYRLTAHVYKNRVEIP